MAVPSLRTFRFKQPKKTTSDELLATRPEVAAELEVLNAKYLAASQHYKRCTNKLGSYLLASNSEKANEMKQLVESMKHLKAQLILKRKDLERQLILEEAQFILSLPERAPSA
jgi:hypothetical protein